MNLDDADNESSGHRNRSIAEKQQQHGRTSQEQTNNTVTDDHVGGDRELIHAGESPTNREQESSSVRVSRQSSSYDEDNRIDDVNTNGGERRAGATSALGTERSAREPTARSSSGSISSKPGSGHTRHQETDQNVDRSSINIDGKPLSGVASSSNSSSNVGMPPSQPRPSFSSSHMDSGEVGREDADTTDGGRVAGGEQLAGQAGCGDLQSGARKQDEGTTKSLPPTPVLPRRLASNYLKIDSPNDNAGWCGQRLGQA